MMTEKAFLKKFYEEITYVNCRRFRPSFNYIPGYWLLTQDDWLDIIQATAIECIRSAVHERYDEEKSPQLFSYIHIVIDRRIRAHITRNITNNPARPNDMPFEEYFEMFEGKPDRKSRFGPTKRDDKENPY